MMFWFNKWYLKQRSDYNAVVRPILTGGFRLPNSYSSHSAHSWHPFTLASQLTLSNVSLPFPVLRGSLTISRITSRQCGSCTCDESTLSVCSILTLDISGASLKSSVCSSSRRKITSPRLTCNSIWSKKSVPNNRLCFPNTLLETTCAVTENSCPSAVITFVNSPEVSLSAEPKPSNLSLPFPSGGDPNLAYSSDRDQLAFSTR